MWSVRELAAGDARSLRLVIERDAQPVSRAEVFNRWQHDAVFRAYFGQLLADAPFDAFRWETPPVTRASLEQPFEFVLIDSPELLKAADPDAFGDHFADARERPVIEFGNLGGDAWLLVPCPTGPATAYAHLAAFLRQAPNPQQHALWTRMGAAMQRCVGDRPVWLSTAGAGVPWLHVRIDDRPKYYAYGAYR